LIYTNPPNSGAAGRGSLEALQDDPRLGQVTALLLAESGYAPVNPREWIEKLRPQVVLLSVAQVTGRAYLARRRWRRWRAILCCAQIEMGGSN